MTSAQSNSGIKELFEDIGKKYLDSNSENKESGNQNQKPEEDQNPKKDEKKREKKEKNEKQKNIQLGSKNVDKKERKSFC